MKLTDGKLAGPNDTESNNHNTNKILLSLVTVTIVVSSSLQRRSNRASTAS